MADRSKFLDEHLNESEQLFVEYYFNQSSPTFGNGTQSIISALGEGRFTDDKGKLNLNLAGVTAHEWLRIPKVYKAGMEFMNSQEFNDASVDNQHTFLINQSADMNVKAKGIDMYNKLKGRYTDKKQIEFTTPISVNIITGGN